MEIVRLKSKAIQGILYTGTYESLNSVMEFLESNGFKVETHSYKKLYTTAYAEIKVEKEGQHDEINLGGFDTAFITILEPKWGTSCQQVEVLSVNQLRNLFNAEKLLSEAGITATKEEVRKYGKKKK